MNKLIASQLEKVKLANLSNYDEETMTYHIPKYVEFSYQVDHVYLIKLDKSLLSKDGNEILVCNWNNGNFPLCDTMKVDVVKIVGKMINVNGIGFDTATNQDTNYLFSGWLPTQQITLIESY